MPVSTTSTIHETVKSYLCTGCGTCVGICPENAIRMIETPGGLLRPRIEDSDCAECGLCLRVCPGAGLPENVTAPLNDPFVGNVLKAYTGYALDPELRLSSQSGGIVTALLLHALDSKQIDGAVVTYLSCDGTLRPQTIIASEPGDVRRAQKSKYCPVAANSILTELMKAPRKIAFVGLPCHVQGVRNAQNTFPSLADSVAVAIGLFCERTLSFGALEYLVDKARMSKHKVVEFAYRDKRWRGWPGDIFLKDGGGRERYLPRTHRMRAKDAFTPLRCRLCFDQLNVLADISVGDSWGVCEDILGVSSILVRTHRGKSLLESALQAGKIAVRECAGSDIARGQSIERRRANFSTYSAAWSATGHRVPRYVFRDGAPEPGLPADVASYGRRLRQSLRTETVKKRATALRRARSQILFSRLKALPRRTLLRGLHSLIGLTRVPSRLLRGPRRAH